MTDAALFLTSQAIAIPIVVSVIYAKLPMWTLAGFVIGGSITDALLLLVRP